MKKFIAILLVLTMLTSIVGCSKEGGNGTTGAPKEYAPLQVGYAKKVITPEEPMILDGSFDKTNRISENVLDDLYATCTAFTDAEGNTILLYQMDLLVCSTWTVLCRKAIAEKTGVPFENVMVACTHTHSGPDVRSGYETEQRYTELLKTRMTEAAVDALADRKSAEMYSSSIELEKLNFIRHYIMNDGSIVGDNFGETNGKTYLAHTEDTDNVMQVLCFKRQGGNDVVLINWQTHPHRGGGRLNTNITADIVGAMRTYMETELGCSFAYFTGASGNINPTSRISSENITSSMKNQGEEMGRYAILALDNLEKLQTGKVQILKEDFENVDGIGNTMAFSIGDAAFAMAPYEMFNANGMFIKKNSPFATTFVVTCANTHSGYVPSASVYKYDVVAYEMSRGYKEGTAENLASGFVGLLKKLYDTRLFDGTVTPLGTETAGADLYWNLDKGTERKAGSDGTYGVNFLKDGKSVTLKVADQAMMKAVDALDVMGLKLDGDKITAVFPLSQTDYHRLAWDYTVVSNESNIVKVNSSGRLNGKEISFVLNTATKVYDLSEAATTPGELTVIQTGDVVTVIMNADNKAVAVYVTERVAKSEPDPTPRYCQHCKQELTTWHKWVGTNTLPVTEGHYYLAGNVNLTETVTAGSGNICLDLNGKTVTQTKTGERIYDLQGSAVLNLMDSGETGTLIPASADTDSKYKYGMGITTDSEKAALNFYSGTIDASNVSAMYALGIYSSQGVVTIYGGTIKGGKAWGSGGACMTVGTSGNLVMYDGTMIGGVVTTEYDYNSGVNNGGATLRVAGKATIYGGTFTGGSTIYNGGSLYVRYDGTLTMLGGTVSGGKADGNGDSLYMDVGGKLILGGNVNITGGEGSNVYLEGNMKIAIHEDGLDGAKIGITMNNPGVFVEGTFTAEDASCFISDDSTKTVTLTNEGIALAG